jgi:hypothetical protein
MTAHMNAGNTTVRVPALVLGGPQTKWLVDNERSVYDPLRVTVAGLLRSHPAADRRRDREGAMRNLTRIALGSALTIAALGSGTAAYADGAVVDRSKVRNEVVVIDFTNPCTGQTDEITLVQSGISQTVNRPNDTFNALDSHHGTFEFQDGTTGTFVAVDIIAGGTNGVGTTVIRARGTTPTGEPVVVALLIHFTQNGQGDVVVEFLKGC